MDDERTIKEMMLAGDRDSLYGALRRIKASAQEELGAALGADADVPRLQVDRICSMRLVADLDDVRRLEFDVEGWVREQARGLAKEFVRRCETIAVVGLADVAGRMTLNNDGRQLDLHLSMDMVSRRVEGEPKAEG